jgi:hypothetical protein
VSPVKYEMGFYIPEDGILHSHCRENVKSYTTLRIVERQTDIKGLALYERPYCLLLSARTTEVEVGSDCELKGFWKWMCELQNESKLKVVTRTANLRNSFFVYLWGWSGTESIITAAIYLPIVPALIIDDDDCGAINGMTEWQGKPQYSEGTYPKAAVHHRSHMT